MSQFVIQQAPSSSSPEYFLIELQGTVETAGEGMALDGLELGSLEYRVSWAFSPFSPNLPTQSL